MQEHVIGFKNGWANHSLRTEHNRIPIQLWVIGYLDMDESKNQVLLCNLQSVTCMFFLHILYVLYDT